MVRAPRSMPFMVVLASACGSFKDDAFLPTSAIVLLQREAISLKHSAAEKLLKAGLKEDVSIMNVPTGASEVPPVFHDLSLAGRSAHLLDVHQSATDAMYQCASEYDEPKLGCAECTMNRTCACDGFARFGYGSKWSEWKNVSGTVSCDSTEFGDPYTGHGKVCMCMPQVYTCATEWETPTANCSECTMQDQCSCLGSVRMGYGDKWSPWKPTAGSTTCRVSEFGSDPYEGHGKICQCQPSLDFLQKMSSETGVGAVLDSISAITLFYFIATMLYNLFLDSEGSIWQQTFETLMSTMRLAPMICAVLFAVVKRAATLTAENTELYWLPQLYLKIAVVCCAATFIAQAMFYTCAEYVAQKEAMTGQLAAGPQSRLRILISFGDFALTLMHLALLVTLVGIVLMKEPGSLYGIMGKTPVAPGTVCTIILAAVYFAVYRALHSMKSGHEPDELEQPSYALEVMRLAAAILNIAPMICALFLAVQIAADWQGVSLPRNVEVSLYVCAVSLLVQVALVLITPAFAGANVRSSGSGTEVEFVTRSRASFMLVSLVRWLAIAILYICVGVIGIAFWTLQLVPRLTHLLIVLMAVFFVVYMALWVSITLRQLLTGFTRVIRVLGVTKDAAMLSPMLVILILGSWVRSHQMTNALGEPGEPQGWVQDYMRVAVCAFIFMLMMMIFRGWSAQQPANLELQHEITEKGTEAGVFVVFIPMLVMCVSVAIIIVGLFMITPETATADGAWFDWFA